LAPDVDLFAEVTNIATHFATQHGDRIMADIGIDPRAVPVDLDGFKASFGLPSETPSLTYRDIQERRQLIQKRMGGRKKR